MKGSFRWLTRVAGFALLMGGLYPFFQALRALEHREYVGGALAALVGWLVTQAGVELIRPESAE